VCDILNWRIKFQKKINLTQKNFREKDKKYRMIYLIKEQNYIFLQNRSIFPKYCFTKKTGES